MTIAVVDIETDDLNATKIHCIVARSYSSDKEKVWVGEECGQFAEWSGQIDQFIMHNGISFDAPILNRLTGSNIKLSQVRDTLIESQLYNPIREGGHSVEAWGERLHFHKGNMTKFYCFIFLLCSFAVVESSQHSVFSIAVSISFSLFLDSAL